MRGDFKLVIEDRNQFMLSYDRREHLPPAPRHVRALRRTRARETSAVLDSVATLVANVEFAATTVEDIRATAFITTDPTQRGGGEDGMARGRGAMIVCGSCLCGARKR